MISFTKPLLASASALPMPVQESFVTVEQPIDHPRLVLYASPEELLVKAFENLQQAIAEHHDELLR